MRVRSTTPTRRDELLAAAEAILSTEGVHALSLRDIAARSGHSTQGVYTEFGGKPGLIDALYREGYARLADALAGVDPGLPPLQRAAAAAHAYRDSALASPHLYDLMTGNPVAEYSPPPASRTEAEATFDVLVAAIRDAIDAGELEAASARHVAHLLWTVGHGHVSLVIRGMQPDDPATWDLLFELVIDGFRPDPAATPPADATDNRAESV